ncbi:DUF535 family protein [Rhizobium sp. L1K21]|uniref:DUF535 family protein n=1 Tax=Rhizobium sp. L1K21 TaxID=2954933 RepID=UPI002092E118|nr:DUF535 family protein [Rhizobium sp. L1K21]MCO6184843.1 VirK/YbjX family protein [Rhizobium sp. L1K21]
MIGELHPFFVCSRMNYFYGKIHLYRSLWAHLNSVSKSLLPSEIKSFALRSLFSPSGTYDYIVFLRKYLGELQLPFGLFPREASKPLKPFLTPGLRLAQRVALLKDHHEVARKCLGDTALRQLWKEGAVAILCLCGTRGRRYRLSLDIPSISRHEGALSFVFSELDQESGEWVLLSAITFILSDSWLGDGRRALIIGGLQGSNREGSKDAMVAATRNLGGMRPKFAVLLAVQALADLTGIVDIFAVSNQTHLINVRKRSSRKRMYADLDGYWIEQGATEDPKIGFRMPLLRTHSKKFRGEIVEAVKALV